jgi:signal transduction histidine kinase/CheY-like chemotaxis protein
MRHGIMREWQNHYVPQVDASGNVLGFFSIIYDLTEQRRLEARLLQAQKMEAIGQLTGGIAHDFNNMLSIIIGNLELLESHVADETGARRAKMALEGALRCASMTKRLLTFARRQPLQAKTIELNGFVEGMLELARRMLADTAEFRFTPVERLWPLKTDPTQLEAALVNLAVNARDAMPEGGVISFELRNVPWEEMPREAAELAEGDYVMIAVSDTGGGMDAETLERVFEPFFTTKEIGRGTGLGLSTTYGFVKQAGGHIAIESAPGEGTTVRLWLPRGDGAAAEPAREPADVARARGETVLVVEDEEAVREVAVTALSRLGYSVIEADTAERGLQLLEETPEIELLFTDVLMPGPIDGRALARAARRIRPAIKVLYASGYGGDVAEEDAPFLRKPYLGDDLAQRVRDVLDGVATEPEPV